MNQLFSPKVGLACLLVVFTTLSSRAQSADSSPLARTIAGNSFRGQLLNIDEKWNVRFETSGGERVVARDELILWGGAADREDAVLVLLADGSRLAAIDVQLRDKKLLVEAENWGEPAGAEPWGTLEFPLDLVRGVVFRVPLEPLARARLLKRISTAQGNNDRLLLANGDSLAGTFTRLQRETVGEDQLGRLVLSMETKSGAVEIRPDTESGRLLEKVEAMIFNPLLVRKPAGGGEDTIIAFRDGSRLYARSIQPRGEQATFTLASGAKISSHPDLNVWRQITSLRPLGDHVTYLTDLKPVGYLHIPLLEQKWPLGEDANVLGGRLRAGGEVFDRGLGMHSRSRVDYALDKPYRRFEAELAVDEAAGLKGSVQFLVLSDAGGTFRPVRSPIIRGGQKPTPISVDISGAKRIVLAVEAADWGTELDYANWLNARLVP